MHLLVYGPGRLGLAIAGAAVSAGWPAPTLQGLPAEVVVRAGDDRLARPRVEPEAWLSWRVEAGSD